jgi:hypothetical protein
MRSNSWVSLREEGVGDLGDDEGWEFGFASDEGSELALGR